MTERIFHLVPATNVARFEATSGANWAPLSLASEGFIHLSFGHQIAGTLGVHFANDDKVLIVEIDRLKVASDLKVEISRGSEAFPHVYRAFNRADVLRGWHLQRDVNGDWQVPLFAETWAGDQPESTWLPE